MKHLFLDSHPLSLLSKPNITPDVAAILTWFHSIRTAGHSVYIPEVIDYEVRRELVRSGRTLSVTRLDLLKLTATLRSDQLPSDAPCGGSVGTGAECRSIYRRPEETGHRCHSRRTDSDSRHNVRVAYQRLCDNNVERRASFPLRRRCGRVDEFYPVNGTRWLFVPCRFL